MEHKFVVIGNGGHVKQSHVPYLNVVGVVDPDPSNGIDGVPHYLTEQDLYSSNLEFDGVVIGSPDRFHFASIMEGVNNHKHIFCEKPVCETSEQMESLAQLLETHTANGKTFNSCHPRRFDPPYLHAQQNLEKMVALYGNPVALTLTFHYPRTDKINHSGLLADHLNHEIDFANMLFGFSPVVEAIKVHDSHERYCVTGKRADGIGFMFVGNRLSDTPPYQEDYVIHFERGNVSVNCHTGQVEGFDSCDGTDYVSRFTGINDDFVSSCGGAEPYLTHREIFENTRVAIELQ